MSGPMREDVVLDLKHASQVCDPSSTEFLWLKGPCTYFSVWPENMSFISEAGCEGFLETGLHSLSGGSLIPLSHWAGASYLRKELKVFKQGEKES